MHNTLKWVTSSQAVSVTCTGAASPAVVYAVLMSDTAKCIKLMVHSITDILSVILALMIMQTCNKQESGMCIFGEKKKTIIKVGAMS